MAKRKNENYSPFVSAGTKSPKAFLFVSVIAALCADVCVSALLIWSQVPVLYWIFPVLAMAADALFLLGAVFTNFRFKYSVGELCAFVIFVCAMVIAENVVNFNGETVSLSTVAAVMWTLSHLLSVFCVIATAMHASKRFKAGKAARLIAATLFCVLAAAVAALYGLFVLGGGFFGQGGYDIRPLEYAYNEATDSYEVKGVMKGRGSIVVIPETFNEKKVDAVSYNVFTAKGVTDVNMMSADVKFTDTEELAHFDGEIKIHAPKEDVEVLRKAIYGARGTTFRAYDLANCVVPMVDADEVYVKFTYDKDGYATVDGKVMPIWIGKKGETFRLFRYIENYSYVGYSASSDESGLYDSYTKFGGKVLKALNFTEETADGASAEAKKLDGAKIEKSGKVEIKFENVYRIKVQSDNDTKYEPGTTFKSLFRNGNFTGYRYATAATFDGVLNEIKDSRDGFTLSYNYGITSTSTGQRYHDFASSVEGFVSSLTANTVYVYPVWAMKAPTIVSATSNAAGGNIVYGEDLEVKASAKAPADELYVSYAWSGAYTSNATSFTIPRIKKNQGGTFVLTVKAFGSGTSLTSTATASVSVTVLSRPIFFNWTGTETVTYDGNAHEVSCAIKPQAAGSGVLSGDNVLLRLRCNNSGVVNNTVSFTNAGTWTVWGELAGADTDNYYVGGVSTVNKVINKAPLTVNWTGSTQFVYDKTLHAPSYEVSGGIGSEDIMVGVQGASTYANAYTNTQYYTATAVTLNNNYYVASGATQRFTVAQRELEIVWLTDTIAYTGEFMAPLAMLSSTNDNVIEGDTVQLDRTGFQRYTNEYTGVAEYTATATIGNKNYKATDATAIKKFRIVAKNVSFVWDGTTEFVYNGNVQYPKVTDISGAYAGDLSALLASVTYEGGGRNVADGSRTAFATLSNKNYSVEESSRTSGYFNITPKPIKVTFTDSENKMPYMATVMTPTHSVDGRIGNEDVGLELDGRGENVGDYTITPRATNLNYTVTSAPFNYSITPAPVVLDWGTAALTYNGKVHSPEPTVTSKVYSRGKELGLSWEYDRDEKHRINNCEFTATANITNPNYEIVEGKTQTFGINPIWLEVEWKNTSLVYNGSAQSPVAVIKNKSLIVEGDEIEIVVTGSATEVGAYTATAHIKYDTTAPGVNYRLYDETRTVTFVITQPSPQTIDYTDGKKYGVQGGSV